MISNRLTTLTLIIGSLLSVALVGCQTTDLMHINKTGSVNSDINDENWSTYTPQSYLLQTLTNYDWQLTQIKGTDNKVKPFIHQPSLFMEVRPNLLLFKEGCQRYRTFFNETYKLPYPYSFSDSSQTILNQCKNDDEGAIQSALDSIFKSNINVYFKFEPLTKYSFSKDNAKKMALAMDNGVTLLFTGTPKSEQEISGLPITNTLLEQYQWRLINATDDKNQLIDDFTDVDAPITGQFHTDEYRQIAGFSVGCNGAGGPYSLSANHTLFIGGGPRTMISCGKKLDDIQLKFGSLISYSASTLTLTMQEKAATSENGNQILPYYLLTQKLDSGETLIWKNEKEVTR